MQKINITLPFATLLPEFIFQFMSAEQVDQESFTCMELEDLRLALMNANEPELAEIKQFLNIGEDEGAQSPENPEEEDEPADELEQFEGMMGHVDEAIEEVDEEYYHRYTSAELRYIFERIIFNIDTVYDYFLKETGLPLTMSIGFRIKDGDTMREAGLVMDFMHLQEKPEPEEEAFFVPMKNYLVSDDIIARAYFIYEPEMRENYEKVFNEIAETLELKGMGGANGEKGPRPDLH